MVKTEKAVKMIKITINNRPVSVPEGTSIMHAAAAIGISIPHLCYWQGLNEIAACRVCVVEVKGKEHLITACNNEVKEGMEIYTNSPRVRETRKTNVRLILSQHDCRCAICVRSGNCSLQTIANDLGCITNPYGEEPEKNEWNPDFPIIRDNAKCIKCMRCIQVCDKIQTLHVWDVVNTGSRTTVNVANGQKIENADCTVCGQCITHCPVGALRERDDISKVLDALNDPEKITVVQVAPAVRAAWGEALHMKPEAATEKRLAAVLRHVGFDYVFDTNFGADLTIIEEANEFVERLKSGKMQGKQFPMFTSCCPGWVRFVKTQYPELIPHLSTAKSPQQMFGAMTKSYFAQKAGIDPAKIFSVSLMPCTAKKAECEIPVMNSAGAGQDVDCVLTTRELTRLIRGEAMIPEALAEEEFDSPLGTYSGAGVIFGVTGGVMEAALRTAYCMVTGENPLPDAFEAVRGMRPWKEASYTMNGTEIHTAVVHGLGNARQLIQALKRGEVFYHFVEVMACPGGCVGGGGQPIHDGFDYADLRAPVLYHLDKKAAKRFSHENPEIHAAYRDFLKEAGSEIAEKLLHTDHRAWEV